MWVDVGSLCGFGFCCTYSDGGSGNGNGERSDGYGLPVSRCEFLTLFLCVLIFVQLVTDFNIAKFIQLDGGREKQQKQELGWRVSIIIITHSCIPLCTVHVCTCNT